MTTEQPRELTRRECDRIIGALMGCLAVQLESATYTELAKLLPGIFGCAPNGDDAWPLLWQSNPDRAREIGRLAAPVTAVCEALASLGGREHIGETLAEIADNESIAFNLQLGAMARASLAEVADYQKKGNS